MSRGGQSITERAIALIRDQLGGISPEGVSQWVERETFDTFMNELHGVPIPRNGHPLIQNDRGLGVHFVVQKDQPQNAPRAAWDSFRLFGFKAAPQQTHRRTAAVQGACVCCGSSSRIESDHKDGRHSAGVATTHEFQPLCNHCNNLKRSRCAVCIQSGERFDAKTLGYQVGWTGGKVGYEPRRGCQGCFWHDPKAIRAKLALTGDAPVAPGPTGGGQPPVRPPPPSRP